MTHWLVQYSNNNSTRAIQKSGTSSRRLGCRCIGTQSKNLNNGAVRTTTEIPKQQTKHNMVDNGRPKTGASIGQAQAENRVRCHRFEHLVAQCEGKETGGAETLKKYMDPNQQHIHGGFEHMRQCKLLDQSFKHNNRKTCDKDNVAISNEHIACGKNI